MSAQQIYHWWFIWFGIGAVLVLAAAALLITIVVLAHRIGGLANTALAVGEAIENNTKPIWKLTATNQVAEQLLVGAQAIGAHAETIAKAVGGAPHAPD